MEEQEVQDGRLDELEVIVHFPPFVAKLILSRIVLLLFIPWSWDHFFFLLTKSYQPREWSRVCVGRGG